ncbi:MAG: chloride channel protein [Bacteroidetes bacterium]|nr:chloride channel protein [Bacteroidota bacterium]
MSFILAKVFEKIQKSIITWRESHAGSRTFLILASIMVGIISALAAILLKSLVHLMQRVPEFLFRWSDSHIWYLVLPVTGILITVVVIRVFFKGKLERGLGSIMFSIVRRSGRVDRNKTYSHIITSGITVGFGGSAGLEAPIVITGSAIGSNIAMRLRFGDRERILLLACGAASGIAAVFNSPIAGVIFAIEVLLTDITIPAFIPLLIATATSSIVSKLLYSGHLFYLITNDWYFHALPFYVLLGIITGLVSVYTSRVTHFIEGRMETKRENYLKALLGGLLLGGLIFLFPALYGEGYITVSALLKGSIGEVVANGPFMAFKDNPWILLMIVLLIVLIKPIATALTLGSGGNGGIFAPSLFIGALTGFGLAFLVNLTGISNLHVNNFVAVGMAGILAGVIHAPLTAIFLIAEITGGYVLFVPLMIVSAISYFISRYFEPYSVYTKKLAQKGHLFTDDKDSNVLRQIVLDDLIETDFIRVRIDDPFTKLIEAFTSSNRNIFPVIDEDDNFIGIVQLDRIKALLFQTELHEKLTVQDIVTSDIVTIEEGEHMDVAMEKLENSSYWNIPVTRNGKYVGFISRSNVLSFYRRILKKTAPLF